MLINKENRLEFGLRIIKILTKNVIYKKYSKMQPDTSLLFLRIFALSKWCYKSNSLCDFNALKVSWLFTINMKYITHIAIFIY